MNKENSCSMKSSNTSGKKSLKNVTLKSPQNAAVHKNLKNLKGKAAFFQKKITCV